MNDRLIPITEAKAKLPELVRDAADHNVILLRHGRPAAMLVSVDRYEALMERLEDLDDRISVYESRESGPDLRIPIEKVEVELGTACSER